MSNEELFGQIADELRNQTVTPAQNTNTPEENTEESSVETSQKTNAVNDQITDSVTQTTPNTEEEEIPWWEKNNETKEETQTQTQTQTETKTEVPELDLDDEIKLLMEYKKSGKTLSDFIKEYQVEDIASWGDEKIVEEGLKNFMKLSEEEFEQALYDYKNSSLFQKKQLVENFREKFQKKNEDKLKQLTQSNTEADLKARAIVEKYHTDLEEFSTNLANKELYGLKITDEMSKNLKNYLEKEFSMTRKDGSIDVEKMYSVALWLNYGADLVKANITKAKNEGKEQVIKEVTNPSKNYTNSGKIVSSGLEAVQEAFSTLFPG
jgi:hypothetical protein